MQLLPEEEMSEIPPAPIVSKSQGFSSLPGWALKCCEEGCGELGAVSVCSSGVSTVCFFPGPR